MDAKPTIICLMGPTAAGKTDVAVELLQHFPCEIISVDSAMVYRGMDIGTAKPDAHLQKIAPHRLIDLCDPSESYSAGQFNHDALAAIQEIIAQNRIPLLVGGTMMYFHTLQNGISNLPSADKITRDRLSQEAETIGWEELHKRLLEVDPIAAAKIHPNDPQRIQRALEVYELTGIKLSDYWQNNIDALQEYNVVNLALLPTDRDHLHQRIQQRFIRMLEQGFIGEVEALYQRGDLHADLPSMRSVGYQQVWDYLAGNLNHQEMQERGIIATRQLAKRQLTWLRSWKELQQIPFENSAKTTQVIEILKPFLN